MPHPQDKQQARCQRSLVQGHSVTGNISTSRLEVLEFAVPKVLLSLFLERL